MMEKTEWFKCPYCHKALFPITRDTVIRNLVYRCKACKNDIQIDLGEKTDDDKRAGHRV